MQDILDQIIKAEKESAEKIDNFRKKCKKEIEDLENLYEIKKNNIEREILEKNKIRLAQSIGEIQNKIESELLQIREDTEKLSEDAELSSSIKEEIIKIIINK